MTSHATATSSHGAPRRTAIVTGAASGLGRALCERLARDGFLIAICDIDLTGAAETLARVEAAGGSGRIEPLDVADPLAWQSLRERLEHDWPHLDLLVNNAGVAVSGDVGRCSLDDWRWINEYVKAALKALHENGHDIVITELALLLAGDLSIGHCSERHTKGS
jgi:NADP-dependent 3-hydroxy acid dehydrogenase YdfG